MPNAPASPKLALAGHRETVARLHASGKSNRGAAPYSRWVNRWLGRHLAAAAFRLGRTPNQVTAASAVFTFAGIVTIALADLSWVVDAAVCAALLFGYALDSADGQLARLRGGGNPGGEWLDHAVDATKIATFHLAVAIAWYRSYHLSHVGLLLIPLAYSAVNSVYFLALVLADLLRRIALTRPGATRPEYRLLDPTERAPLLRTWIVAPQDYGVLCLVVVLLPARPAFGVAYCALLVANTGFLLAGSVRWFRELTALPSVPTWVEALAP